MNIELTSFQDFNFSESIKLPIIVIYNKPTDFNDKYVARLFNVDLPTPYIVLKNTMDELINEIPKGFIMMNRDKTDDPVIECVFIGGN